MQGEQERSGLVDLDLNSKIDYVSPLTRRSITASARTRDATKTFLRRALLCRLFYKY